jgi:acyl-CoA thioester hydrolase
MYHTVSFYTDVLYADTDAMGIVYYGSYLRFFEAGRLAYVRAFAPDHAVWIPEGVRLPVTEVACRYRRPAVVYDPIRIETCLHEVRRASFTFAYAIFRGDGAELLVEGSSDHAYTDAAGKVKRFDERLMRFFTNARLGSPAPATAG